MKDVKPVAPDEVTTSRPASLVPPADSSTNSHAGFDDIAAMFAALHFAADKHRDQRRKGECASPYINHPIEVAELLVRVGRVTDSTLLQAAILHDTVEDTETTLQELEERFGPGVRRLVEEVSDDKSLPKEERKRLQIEHAASLSEGARQIKLADKICNVRDITSRPPRDWSLERRIGYLEWSEQVVAGCCGVNERLEQAFRDALAEARSTCRNEGCRPY